MAKIAFTRRTGNHYDDKPMTVDGSEVALILIDIWNNHWCPSIKKQTALLAKQDIAAAVDP